MSWIDLVKNVQKRDGLSWQEALQKASKERKDSSAAPEEKSKKVSAKSLKGEKEKIDKAVKDSGNVPEKKKRERGTKMKPQVEIKYDEIMHRGKKKKVANLVINGLEIEY
jgi:hypothetical protein